jgi:beta-mannanase
LNGHNGNTPDLYKQAFQYVVNMFGTWGADNVDWVWCVNGSWHDDFTAAFPGSAYVDRMGMDGFNWNSPWLDPLNDWDDWREFSKIFDNWGGFSTYQTLAALSGEPIIIGETGSNTPEPGTLALLALGGFAVMRRRRT